MPDEAPASRHCGECSLCCTLLRVDALGKAGGTPCVCLRDAGGCEIHARRPAICRSYRCLWLQGGLEEADRPDQLGAIVDLESTGESVRLVIREAQRGQLERNRRLQQIAARYRESMPVRVHDSDDVQNPDAPFRVLLAEGREQRVCGERVDEYQAGRLTERRRLPWIERSVRRAVLAFRKWRLDRLPAHDRARVEAQALRAHEAPEPLPPTDR